MCIRSHSESGQPFGFEPCAAYITLLSEKSRLEGRCKGLEEEADLLKVSLAKETAQLQKALATADNAEGHVKDILARESKELDEIKRLEAENAALRQELSDAIAAWNALPRTPKWVTYDGTEQTLPNPGKTTLVEITFDGYSGKVTFPTAACLSAKTLENDFWWERPQAGPWKATPGDRWTRWPGEE